jgi:hypothetical protein
MIKKLVTITALAMLLGSPASYAGLGFTSGNQLAVKCQGEITGADSGFCYGYVTAALDILQWAAPDYEICLDSNVTQMQAKLVVEKYLKEHPERLHVDANLLVIIALRKAFPCPD